MKKIQEVEWTNHPEYFKLAQKNFRIIQQLKKEHDDLQKSFKNKTLSDKDVHLLAAKNDLIGEHALVVIIFAALTLEAFINHYGISRLSKNYFLNYLDKLDVLSKWMVLPKLITRKQLDPGTSAMQDLSWLIAVRNKLVHYKSRMIKIDDLRESDFLWETDAQRAINTVKRLIPRLKKIDPVVDTIWLQERT
jgi:hypothetical protein